jgi:hypothetical protein
LSITYHTRKRPSTGPQTTHGPQPPPWWVHWQHPHKVIREKKKKKRNEQKKTPTSDRKPNKGKEQDHLKKTSLGPLRQGKRLDTSERKLCSSKERKPPNQSKKNHKELPLHACKLPPKPMQLPLDECMQYNSALTGHTGQYHRSDRCATCEHDQHSDRQTGDLDRSDRCTPKPRNGSKPPESLLNASSKTFQAQTTPPCWQCMNQAKNAKLST